MSGAPTPPPVPDGVAIVGMAGRFPGAPDVDTLWDRLRRGDELISFFADEELDPLVPAADLMRPEYVRARGVIADEDKFDAAFFGFTPREAEVMDPQQRVFLEIAWAAFEHAGYDPVRANGLVGVYAGMSNNTYHPVYLASRPDVTAKAGEYPVMMGNEKDYIATRTSYKLNLTGPSVSIHTACSTSLVAVAHAYHALLGYQCDMALAGGVSIMLPQRRGYLHTEGGIASPDGHCRAFDAEARGCAFSNGAAAVVLKRVDDAVADGDTIYAVIRGVGMTNDGSQKVGFTAPGVEGQAAAIAMAHAAADVPPDSISYVEAHGTATAIGDPIEVAALTKAFRAKTDRTAFCGIGSVKSNLGHLDVAAGVTGLIKTALALHHRTIPPSINYTSPNPEIDFAASPFYVCTGLTEWTAPDGPRRAGISSFGLGGTNAHVILEEAPAPTAPTSTDGRLHLLPISARTDEALERMTQNLAAYLAGAPAELADVAHTLQIGRRRFPHRRIVVARSVPDATDALGDLDPERVITARRDVSNAPVFFMFPGGGAQYRDMARGLYDAHAEFRRRFDGCAEHLARTESLDLHTILYPSGAPEEALENPTEALPALFAVEYALAGLWSSWGIEPAAMIGHSMGEYTAACVAGVMSPDDALSLVALRGRLFDTLPAGAMASVRLAEEELVPLLPDDITVAAVNAPSLCVVSGPAASLDGWEADMAERDIDTSRLHIHVAAHSALVEPILEAFGEFARGIALNPPAIPYVSNVTGTWMTADDATDPDYWVRHLRRAVRFSDGVHALAERDGVWLEVGPGQTLSTFARQHAERPGDRVVVASLRHPREDTADDTFLARSLGRLWVAGVDVDWTAVHGGSPRRRVPLPTYPFERTRFWVEPSGDAAPTTDPSPPAPTVEPALPASEPIVPISALAPSAPEPDDRRARILVALQTIIEDLSGISAEYLDPRSTFLELGLDSLFLTQANTAIKKRFAVKITFRQLFDTAPTLDALAGYIDEQLPPEAFPPPAVAAAPPHVLDTDPPAATPATPSNDAPAGGEPSLVERVINRQLEVMREQLAALGVPGEGPPPTPVPPTAAAVPTTSSAAPEPSATGEVSVTGDLSKRFGPWRPVDAARGQELTDRQREALTDFIARYTARTPQSKALTDAQRPHLADARSITGFRQAWKELVYQIAMVRSSGSTMWDLDGNEYVDLTMGFGINLFGYSPSFVVNAVRDQMDRGFELGALTPLAREVADLLCDMTGAERATFVNTGSEAVSAAIRAARTVTGRDRIAVFEGDYHGIADEVLVRPVTVRGERVSAPVSPGIPRHIVENVLILDYADPDLAGTLARHADELAAVVVEPVQNRNPGFHPRDTLATVREITARHETPLIFDEMITGLRLHPRGAQGWYGIEADLAAYGKALSGGLPMAAVAGKAAFLDAFDGGAWQFGDDSFPEAGVTFFGGTFVRHPLSMAAARAVLHHLKRVGPDLQRDLNTRADTFAERINERFDAAGAPMRIAHAGSFMSLLFTDDNPLTRLVFHYLRHEGVHIWDRPFFLSTAHTDADLDRVIDALSTTLDAMERAGFFDSTASPRTVTPTPAPAKPAAAAPMVPITPGQREIWLAAQLCDDASRAFHSSVALDLRGSLDVPAMTAALEGLVDRHEALRTTFDAGDDHQRIHPTMAVPPTVVDLSAGGGESALERLLQEDRERLFDLTDGPLARFYIATLRPEHHRVVITVHHIVCDGWSIDMLLRDLAAFYSAAGGGTPPSLDAAVPFRRYAEWIASPDRDAEARAAEDYWVGQFDDLPPVLDLPTDRPRPPVKTFAAHQRRITVDGERLDALRSAASRRGATLFGTLLTAFAALLHRLSGEDDLVIGVAAAGQAAMGEPNLVGHCVNLLPFRSRLAPDTSVERFLSQTQSRLWDGFDHQDFTFGSLIERLRIPRDASRIPLIAATLTHETPTDGIAFDGLAAEAFSNPKTYCNFDLEGYVIEDEDRLSFEINYNTDLIDDDTAERWLAHLDAIVTGIVTDDDGLVVQLPIFDEASRHRLLRAWNDTDAPTSNAATVHAYLAAISVDDATVAVDSAAGRLTYGELRTRAAQLANHLIAEGISPGDRVGIGVPRGPDLVVAVLGVLEAGATYVPLDPDFPPDRLAFMVEDAGVSTIVAYAEGLDRLPGDGIRVIPIDVDWQTIARAGSEPPPTRVTDLAYVIYTSGSTGRPKGVRVPHRAVINFLDSMRRTPGIAHDDVLLAVTTLSFDISVLEILLPLAVGARVYLVDGDTAADGRRLAEAIDLSGATMLQATPATWQLLFDAGWEGSDRLTALCGGEAVPPDLARRLAGSVRRAWNMYGPTETTIWSTCGEIVEDGPVTIGTPIANTRVYVLDRARQLAPVGVAGELYIAGAGVTDGYWNRPDLTADRFVPDPFAEDAGARMYRTGDLARWRADGRLEHLGRSDRQVKVRGFRIELPEIESVLRQHDAIREAVVEVREAHPGDGRLVAYMVYHEDELTSSEVRRFLRQSLPDYMIPGLVISLDDLPRTPNGKLDRAALPDPFTRARDEAGSSPPASDRERLVADVWQGVLEIDEVRTGDNFFELGGHSLLSIRAVYAIEERTGHRLDPRLLFFQTLEQIAAALPAEAPDPSVS